MLLLYSRLIPSPFNLRTLWWWWWSQSGVLFRLCNSTNRPDQCQQSLSFLLKTWHFIKSYSFLLHFYSSPEKTMIYHCSTFTSRYMMFDIKCFKLGLVGDIIPANRNWCLDAITFDVKLEFSFLEVASSDRNQKKNMQIGNNVQSHLALQNGKGPSDWFLIIVNLFTALWLRLA